MLDKECTPPQFVFIQKKCKPWHCCDRGPNTGCLYRPAAHTFETQVKPVFVDFFLATCLGNYSCLQPNPFPAPVHTDPESITSWGSAKVAWLPSSSPSHEVYDKGEVGLHLLPAMCTGSNHILKVIKKIVCICHIPNCSSCIFLQGTTSNKLIISKSKFSCLSLT